MTTTTETKSFHIAAILTIIDGKMIVPMDEIYEILDWMTGESLMTHQLPRASRECEDTLKQAFPDLAEIKVPEGLKTWEKVSAYRESLAPVYGTHRDVPKLDPLDHTTIDPIQELKMLRPDAEIIAVNLEGDE